MGLHISLCLRRNGPRGGKRRAMKTLRDHAYRSEVKRYRLRVPRSLT